MGIKVVAGDDNDGDVGVSCFDSQDHTDRFGDDDEAPKPVTGGRKESPLQHLSMK